MGKYLVRVDSITRACTYRRSSCTIAGLISNHITGHPPGMVKIGFSSFKSGICSASAGRDQRGICLSGKSRADLSGRNLGSSENKPKSRESTEPLWLRAAVSGVTELLRMFDRDRKRNPSPLEATENSPYAIEDIVDGLRQDYARTYFLTGEFLESIYTEDCMFADPTIQFSGRDLYKRNLKLLVPFFEDPLLTLDSIKQGEDSGTRFIETAWKLRVYLKLPWKPFISVDGRTQYNLNGDNKEYKHYAHQDLSKAVVENERNLSPMADILMIIEHIESWNVTGLEAVGQIFKPSNRAFK